MMSLVTYSLSTKHCGLCGSKFPSGPSTNFEAWQNHFRAVFQHSVNNIFLTDVTEFVWVNKRLEATVKKCSSKKIIIAQDRANNTRINDMAFCVHDWCYSIYAWNLNDRSPLTLYHFLQSMEKSPFWQYVIGDNAEVSSETRLQNLPSDPDAAGANFLPAITPRLPNELRSSIWFQNPSRSLYNAFEVVTMYPVGISKQLRSCTQDVLSFAKGTVLSVNTLRIFGTDYIKNMQEVFARVVPMDRLANPRYLSRLKFITKLNGICAIKLITSRWESRWVGRMPSTGRVWYGMVDASDAGIQCYYNYIYLTGVSASGSNSTQILWDRNDYPESLTNPENALFSFTNPENIQTDVLPKQRFFRYLPLRRNLRHVVLYATGLSVYWQENGMVGLESHFSDGVSCYSGRCEGIVVYYPFALGERIAQLWIRSMLGLSKMFAAPTLVIQTTLGRHCTFGPYILPGLVMTDKYKCVLLDKLGVADGIFYESPPREITRIGVHGDKMVSVANALHPQYLSNCGPLTTIGYPDSGLFLSVANLKEVCNIDMCRVGDRCTGLMLCYRYDPPLTLGQWYTPGVAKHCCIFNKYMWGFSMICFKMAITDTLSYVCDISCLKDNCEIIPDKEYLVFGFKQEIAWWFSEDCDDIREWEGRLADIPDKSIIKQSDLPKDGLTSQEPEDDSMREEREKDLEHQFLITDNE